MSNKEHNRIGFRNRIAKRRLGTIKYTNFVTCPSYVTNPQACHNPNSDTPTSTTTPRIKFKTKFNRHINNENDKLIGKVFPLTTE